MFERKVGGRVEMSGRKDLFNSETPSHTTRLQRRKRRAHQTQTWKQTANLELQRSCFYRRIETYSI